MPLTKTSESVGIGLRRELLAAAQAQPQAVGFWELAPENWLPFNQEYRAQLEPIVEKSHLTAHGLSLSIGGPDPLDLDFVRAVKNFLDTYNIRLYSEHLSFCAADGQLYDLLPMPFTAEAVSYTANRIRIVQDIIERPLVLENVSYYLPLATELTELEFIQAVSDESGCQLLLDVNNVYVNSVNHGYDAREFIQALPTDRIAYGHIAGHFDEASDLLVDTHGDNVKPEVFDLLDFAYRHHGIFPTLLERDFNIPPMADLMGEVERIRTIQSQVVGR